VNVDDEQVSDEDDMVLAEEKRRDAVAENAERVKPVRVMLAPETGVQAKEVWLVDKTESATNAQRVNLVEASSGPERNARCILWVREIRIPTELNKR
jgi:hypothetical protein